MTDREKKRLWIDKLVELRKNDPAEFADQVLAALRSSPETAVEDAAPIEKKTRALDRLIHHFERLERYEDCSFLLQLKTKIVDEDTEILSD